MFPEITHEARAGIRARSTRHPERPHAPVDRLTNSTPEVRIVVADDHPLVLFAVAEALKVVPPFTCRIVATVRSGRELLETLEAQPCELVVTDFSMEPTQADDGLPLIVHLRHRFPDLPVVVFTMLTNGGILQEITQTGVAGMSSKDEIGDALAQVCANALSGKWPALSPGIKKKVAFRSMGGNTPGGRRPLSPGELAVIRLYGLGISVTEISRQLQRSATTVASQKRSAMRKLRIQTNAGLVRFVTDVLLSELNDAPPRVEVEST